ncbi:MAG: flagellar protein [Gammaproteobacteria bacterium]|nr:MAG: flagellar protein [Gammaproteobacteria bacterium]
MAEEKEGQGGGSKKLIIIFAVVALVLVGASVAVTLMLVGGKEEAEPAGEEVVEAPKEPHYFSLDPPFTVNLEGGGKRPRYLQITLDAMTYDEEVLEAVKQHMPLIRNNLVMLFGRQKLEELATPEGKEKLRQETLKTIQQVLEQETGKPGVEAVYFSSFVMQ